MITHWHILGAGTEDPARREGREPSLEETDGKQGFLTGEGRGPKRAQTGRK